jgi:hypothetical protein
MRTKKEAPINTIRRCAREFEDNYPHGAMLPTPCGKAGFHKAGKTFLKDLARELGLAKGAYEVRSLLGGDGVLGEVLLHGESVYVQLGSLDLGVLYRGVKGRKDFVGDRNRWMPWDQASVPALAEVIRRDLGAP